MTIHRTARGATVDISRLLQVNETTVAVGNNRVNARGDQLDEMGNVLVTKNENMNKHYNTDQAGGKRSRFNVPVDEPVGSRRISQKAEADPIDVQRLQESMAESMAAPESFDPPSIDIVDEIDDLVQTTASAQPLRGGLANAIAKQKEQTKTQEKNKRI
jgi:hypothetical protein